MSKSSITAISSASVMVNDVPAGVANPAAEVEPVIRTVSVPSPPVSSSVAVRVKAADPERDPPGMVIASVPLARPVEKSPASAVAAPAAVIVAVTTASSSAVTDPSGREAVTRTVEESPSAMEVSACAVESSKSTLRAMGVEAGRASLSELITMAAPVTDRPVRSAEPAKVMVSGRTSPTSSSVMVRVNDPEASRPPAGMVSRNPAPGRSVLKSEASALPAVPSPAAVTTTTVSVSNVLEPAGKRAATEAVTGASPSPMAF